MYKIKSIALLLGLLFSTLTFAEEVQTLSTIKIEGAPIVTELADLPGSTSVLGQSELVKGGNEYFQNQILDIPNLNSAGGNSRPRFFQIRGIGELEQYEGAPNSSVAVILDDVDVTGVGSAFNLFGIDSLEVHRGPQAVRFGSSALAGAIYLNTEDTQDFYSGKIQSSLGNDELFNGGFSLTSPISDNLEMRLTGFAHDQNGFRDNDFFGAEDTNERQEYTGRLKLYYQLSNESDLTFSFINTQQDNGYDAFTIFNNFHTQSDRPGDDVESFSLASLKGKFKLSDSTVLTSITSYYETDHNYSFDGDWGNNPFWEPFAPYDYFSDSNRMRETFAQQLRTTTTFANDIQLLNGVFYQNLNEDTSINEFSDDILFDSLDSNYRADTLALFSNLITPLTDQLKLTAGVRWERRETQYNDSRGNNFSPLDNMWGGNLSLQYKQSENSIWYILASKGFKGGGFNDSPSLSGDQREFSPESLINLEIGNKASFLDGDLVTSLSAFVNFRRDQQIKLGLQVDPTDPLSFTYLTENAGRGRSYGLEAEVDYLASQNLRFDFSGSLLNTEITSIDPLLASLKGREQSHAPSWQYSLRGEYDLTEDLIFEAGVQGRASFFFDDSHDQRADLYHLINTAISYYVGNWQVRFWARNLGNKSYATRGFFFGNEPPDFPATEYVQLGDPRTYGVTAIYDF